MLWWYISNEIGNFAITVFYLIKGILLKPLTTKMKPQNKTKTKDVFVSSLLIEKPIQTLILTKFC